MNKSPTIMLVDDNDRFRAALKRRLEGHGYQVIDRASGEEAIAYVSSGNTAPISYAFIDHVLQVTAVKRGNLPPINGIETTRQLLEIDHNICVVLFSGQVELSETARRKIFEAGARRYVYKAGGIDIEQLIRELDILQELQSLAETIMQHRELFAATFQEIPVGTLLIDREKIPWVVSHDWRQIEEKSDSFAYPLHSLADSLLSDEHRRTLVETALNGEEQDHLGLCEVQPGRLKYLHTWARPIKNEQGHVIACSLSVVDETESNSIKHMELRRRMKMITDAIIQAGYDRARGYRVSEDEKYLIGVAETGGGLHIEFEGFQLLLDEQHLQETIAERRPRIWSLEVVDTNLSVPLGKTSDGIECPIFDGNRLVGWLVVDREKSYRTNPLSEKEISPLLPYLTEIRKAISDASHRENPSDLPYVSFAEVWSNIERCTDPKEAMDLVLQEVSDLTGCISAHIRVREGEEAVRVAYIGEFPKYRPEHIPLKREFWEVQAILATQTDRPIIVQDKATLPPNLLQEKNTWSDQAKAAFAQVESFAFFPLAYGRPFGVLCVQASKPNFFTPITRSTLQSLARVASTAWVDLSRGRSQQAIAEARFQQAVKEHEMAYATVHNLRQPSTIIRGVLSNLHRSLERDTLTRDTLVELVQDAFKALERNEEIITGVLRYFKPLEQRMQSVDLCAIIEPTVSDWKHAHHDVNITFRIPPGLQVRVDTESIRQVLEELLSNASHSMHGHGIIKLSARHTHITNDDGQSQVDVQIIIEDNGPGVSPDLEETLFNSFKTHSALGTGLGLAFVKRVIEEHGGSIRYERVEPHGSRFICILPAAEEGTSHDT